MTIARILGAAAALSVLSAGAAPAQSLLSARGLGLPLEPVDARARGLGGLPLGLPDAQMSMVNPAASVMLAASRRSESGRGGMTKIPCRNSSGAPRSAHSVSAR